jgi:ABC-type uncharacterized transport system ATPase subunit
MIRFDDIHEQGNPSMSLIHIENLSKQFKILNRREGLSGAFCDLFSGGYRTVEAVAGVSFDINAGEIVGYIGPNGAGKSTTIKMMTGILKPTNGVIPVNGLAPYSHRLSAWASSLSPIGSGRKA